jgi:hypothetical protein
MVRLDFITTHGCHGKCEFVCRQGKVRSETCFKVRFHHNKSLTVVTENVNSFADRVRSETCLKVRLYHNNYHFDPEMHIPLQT